MNNRRTAPGGQMTHMLSAIDDSAESVPCVAL